MAKYLLGIIAIGLVLLLGMTWVREDGGEGVRVGSRAPRFTLRTVAGETVTEQSYPGQILILNFWSSGCSACLRELPDLQRIAESSRAAVIGIALEQDSGSSVRRILQRHCITYPVALGNEQLFERFDGINIPYTLVLDRSRRVIRIYRGPVTKETLEKDIRSLSTAS